MIDIERPEGSTKHPLIPLSDENIHLVLFT